MKNFYLVDSQEQLFNYQQFVSKYEAKWHDYIHFLRKEYQVRDLPKPLSGQMKKLQENYWAKVPYQPTLMISVWS